MATVTLTIPDQDKEILLSFVTAECAALAANMEWGRERWTKAARQQARKTLMALELLQGALRDE